MFSKMDPSGNGYVEQPEFEKYLKKYSINIDACEDYKCKGKPNYQ